LDYPDRPNVITRVLKRVIVGQKDNQRDGSMKGSTSSEDGGGGCKPRNTGGL
jgi:ribosomal protein L4